MIERSLAHELLKLVDSVGGDTQQITISPTVAQMIAAELPPDLMHKLIKQAGEGILAEGSLLFGIPAQVDRRLEPLSVEITTRHRLS